jgi:hypothetical protein
VKVRIVVLDSPHELGGEGQSAIQQGDKERVRAFIDSRDVHGHPRDPSVNLGFTEEDLLV